MIQTLKEALEQRYSTKVFDPTKVAEEEKIQTLIETLRLAPSSINSQPWHLFVISNPHEKERIAEAAWDYNQPKFKDSSHLFVFCAKTEFGENEVREIEQLVADVRGTDLDEERVTLMTNYAGSMGDSVRSEWLKKQVYLQFGQFLLSCALMDLDACPVEGFQPEKMDELLGLTAQGLTSVVVGVVGHRSVNDFNTLDQVAKARFGRDQVVTELK